VPELHAIALFCGAALVLLVVPGPAVLYILARSVSQGRAAGLVSVAGIHVGTLVHVLAATAGLSALLVSSAIAYSVVKWAGGLYLIALGLRRLFAPARGGGDDRPRPQPLGRIFREAVTVNVLNPKTALFFFAFLPQLVDPDAGAVSLQVLVFGLLFVVLGCVTDGCYALVGAAAASRLRRRPERQRQLERGSGAVYVGLGALTLNTGS
jgi:threonine/homoserine/homoserine lactone efflux protein